MDEGVELALLRVLEKKVRAMFEFSGWDENCDEDAAESVRDVERAINLLDSARKVLSEGKDGKP